MGMTADLVEVGTTATLVATVDGSAEVTIHNDGDASVFLGGSGVTTSDGLELAASSTLTLTVDGDLYGIVAADTENVRVLHRA